MSQAASYSRRMSLLQGNLPTGWDQLDNSLKVFKAALQTAERPLRQFYRAWGVDAWEQDVNS